MRNVKQPSLTPFYSAGETAKRKKLAGKPVEPSGVYRDRGGYTDLLNNKGCDCPKPGFEGTLKLFLRGSVGVGYIGGQASIEQNLLATDEIGGPEIKFTAAVGVTGATLEAGFGGHAKFIGPLPGGQ